jgi:predicted O-methyltransferase YrrM
MNNSATVPGTARFAVAAARGIPPASGGRAGRGDTVGLLHKLFGRRSHRDPMRLAQPARESAARPLAPLARFVGAGGLLDDAPAARAALAHAERLRTSLSGTVRDTWLRWGLRSMDAGEALSRLSSPAPACALLAHLVASAGPGWVVEIGSAFGVASVAMATALAAIGRGRFDGIELEPWKAELANDAVRAVLGERARVHAGPVEDVLPALLAEHGRPIDFAFVDALHTYEATWAEHRLLAAAVAPGATVVYDDVPFSDEMRRCWAAIAQAPEVTDALLVAGRWGVARYAGAEARTASGAPALS